MRTQPIGCWIPSRLFKSGGWVGFVLLLVGCATPVDLPKFQVLPPPVNLRTTGLRAPVYQGTVKYIGPPKRKVTYPRAGGTSGFHIPVTPAAQEAYDALLGGSIEAALQALEDASRDPSLTLEQRWLHAFLKAQLLLAGGQASRALDAAAAVAPIEIELTGGNYNAQALRGEILMWLGDVDVAMQHQLQLLRSLGKWSIPITYRGPPANMRDLVMVTTAQLRAYTGIVSGLYFSEQWKAATEWAAFTEHRFNDVHHVASHPLYGRYVNVHFDSYYGRALNLAFWSGARIIHENDARAGDAQATQAKAFFRAIGYQKGMILTDAFRCQALLKIGARDEAEALSRTTAKAAEERGLWDILWRIDALRGDAYFRNQQWEKAERPLSSAQSVIDRITSGFSTEQGKRKFGVDKERVTYALSRIYLQRQDWQPLITTLEKGRARAFADLIASQGTLGGTLGAPYREIRQLDQRLQTVHRQLANLTPHTTPWDVQSTTLQKLQQQRQQAVERLAASNQSLASGLGHVGITLHDLQGELKPDAALWYILPAEPREPIAFLHIRPDSIEPLQINLTHAEARHLLKRDGGRKVMSAWEPAADKAYLQGVRKIFLVASGATWFMPWGQLGQELAIAQVPSATWLTYPQVTPHHQGATVLGDPEFGGQFPPLPGAREEAKTVAGLLNTEALMGAQATEAALREKVHTGKEVLHLASHAYYRRHQPMQSALVLSGANGASSLTASKLFESPLPARLVILSACESGLGTVMSGNDLVGLQRSFFLGGTQTVLSSLWKVEDEGTRRFMEVFHRQRPQLGTGPAWRKACETLKAEGFPPEVYAAFVLAGRME